MVLEFSGLASDLKSITEKVIASQRITDEECITLYEQGEPGFLALLANYTRERLNKKYVYFNRNFHIEPSNICIYNCSFCSYYRKNNDPESWNFTLEEIKNKIAAYKNSNITEIHVVGSVHPDHDLNYYCEILKTIRKELPDIHIKAFSAVEIDFIAKKQKISYEQTFKSLIESGLNSIPGGGAEIFDPEIRTIICKDKCSADEWLLIHKTAHQLNIPTNATMLYGHIESYSHRVKHMRLLRDLQDETNGFNTFIPLKFRNKNNELSHLPEVSVIEDMRNYAISRIYLDNFPHLKAYWPMLGKDMAQVSLNFGVDDIDGTIDDSTKIYSMAGAEEKNPGMDTDSIVNLIKRAGFIPAERDTLYHIIQLYNEP
jgi:aminodeoxyfutalosine synthase